jgi:hypothetical protein
MTPQESLSQLNFWLLFFIFGLGAACGLLFLNNAGEFSRRIPPFFRALSSFRTPPALRTNTELIALHS